MPWPPIHTAPRLRAGVCGLLGIAALGGTTVALSSSAAVAAADPCAASQIAKTVGVVANNTGAYLDTHPQTNQALTTISQQQAGPQTLVSLRAYFDANPQAGKNLQAIQVGGPNPPTATATATASAMAVPARGGPLPGPAPYTAR